MASNETPELKYKIPGVHLLHSDEVMGKFNLYEYQADAVEQLRTEDKCLLQIHAGTGMGKTAIAVMGVVESSPKRAVMVYPTNELIDNQQQSIRKTCRALGVEEPDIVRVHSAEMRRLITEEDYRSKSKALADNLRPPLKDKPKFILTNPDTLHLVLRFKYGRGRYNEQAARVLNVLGSYSTLVLDEFHYYELRELSALYFDLCFAGFLGMFSRILLMTATPHSGLERYLNHVAAASDMQTPQPVTAQEADSGRQVIHEVDFSILPENDDDLKQMADYLIERRDELATLREENKASDYLPACVILNSVIDARSLTEMLLASEEFEDGEIKESHGLVPQNIRRERESALVLVGTSAIEVGIDFDTSYLLFQAWSASSAVQRIGRVGRHRSGRALLFAPKYVYRYFDTYVEDVKSRSNMMQYIEDGFSDEDPGLWYLESPYARMEAEHFVSNLVDMISATPAGGTYVNEDELLEFLDEAYPQTDTSSIKPEWKEHIEKSADTLVTLRSTDASALVRDYVAERRGLFPVYFSPLYRILRRAQKYKLFGNDNDDAKKYIYAAKGELDTDNQKSTIDNLMAEYSSHVRYHRPVCISQVFGYMKDKSRFVKMRYDALPNKIPFAPVVGINTKDFLGTDIGFDGLRDPEEVADNLFENELYAIVDKSTAKKIGWRIPSYPVVGGSRGGRVYFGGNALVALAAYDKFQEGENS
ncbi:MAG: type I-D CRISPR-associated helicase Cas3' [Candidatus Lokiarchaeota archaeon]|nr:type I-D CRISPR-associated helicase Cas3' [Candidatus Lokiarchaeota archaeon]